MVCSVVLWVVLAAWPPQLAGIAVSFVCVNKASGAGLGSCTCAVAAIGIDRGAHLITLLCCCCGWRMHQQVWAAAGDAIMIDAALFMLDVHG